MRLAKIFLALVLSMGLIISVVPNLCADDTSEAILKLLIKKGILTQREVNQMKKEVAKEKPAAPRGLEERVAKLEKDVPSWVKNFKLKGDLRLRHESIWKEQSESNERQRLRFRLGAESKINDALKIGFGLATGSSDGPTSTNQTLEQEFQSKQIWLDYAYAEYKPTHWATLWGGKFKSPFFHSDLLWDSDIRLDGFAGKVTHTVFKDSDLPETQLYLAGGYFPLDDVHNDSAGDSDLFMNIIQGGTQTKFDKVAKLKTGVAFYDFHNMEGYSNAFLEEDSKSTNTRFGTGMANDFRVVSPSLKLTLNNPLDIGFPVSFIGELAKNTATSEDNNGWRMGVEFGKKVKKKGDWRLIGQYSRLERDVFYEGFPDGDFNSGGTDAKGWEVIADYGLFKNVILSLDYYNTATINGATSDEQVLQADVIFKF